MLEPRISWALIKPDGNIHANEWHEATRGSILWEQARLLLLREPEAIYFDIHHGGGYKRRFWIDRGFPADDVCLEIIASVAAATEPVNTPCRTSGVVTVLDKVGPGLYEERRKCDGEILRRITRG